MDDVVTRFARELADAIAAAVAESPEVEACRERARHAGYAMKVSLEAVVGFVARAPDKDRGVAAANGAPAPARAVAAKKPVEMTANDRRFLRSLRIAADDVWIEETDRSG
jgi:hypothetical protein